MINEETMSIFYRATEKELLNHRNRIFLEKGLPALKKNGFYKSPFSTGWFGKDNLRSYSYELCRLKPISQLEIIKVHIARGDIWIKIHLNVFILHPLIVSIDQLNDVDGLQFHLMPNNITEMRLRSDDYKGPPIFYMLFCKEHKLGRYLTKSGLESRVKELGDLIEEDMKDIDRFVIRWHELHKPLKTDWEGKRVE
jgi:hypothetical protein